jgi:CheY-like chemotaxis protein
VTLSPPHVLVVEDDDDIREAIAALAEDSGVTVRAARDGAEGLDFLRGGPRPAAVFLDHYMPRIDGMAVLAAIRQDPALATIPVVWMSGDRAHPAAADSYLEKPFEVPALVELLKSFCPPE